MKQASPTMPAELEAATESLAETLLHAGPLLAYHNARSKIDSSPGARRLLDDLGRAQTDLRRRQAEGTVTEATVDRVRSLQRSIQANALIMAYATAQRTALDFLPTVNQEISELIGLDYAAQAGQGGC